MMSKSAVNGCFRGFGTSQIHLNLVVFPRQPEHSWCTMHDGTGTVWWYSVYRKELLARNSALVSDLESIAAAWHHLYHLLSPVFFAMLVSLSNLHGRFDFPLWERFPGAANSQALFVCWWSGKKSKILISGVPFFFNRISVEVSSSAGRHRVIRQSKPICKTEYTV